MHHQHAPLAPGQRPLAQPVQQRIAVGRGQDVVQGVAAVRRAHAQRHGQQVQVVVAQQAGGGVAQCLHAPQHGQRPRAAVDQVAQQHQAVATGGKRQFVQQATQGRVAALHVADQVECHLPIFSPAHRRPAWTCC